MDVIVDIDGTIADMRHRRHYVHGDGKKDWKTFYQEMINDDPICSVIRIVQALSKEGHQIIYCTGRPESYRVHTVAWLRNNECPYGTLYMREEKDNRKDYITKEALFQRMIKDGYKPQLALEDRDECVKLWRSLGIITLQNSMKEIPA